MFETKFSGYKSFGVAQAMPTQVPSPSQIPPTSEQVLAKAVDILKESALKKQVGGDHYKDTAIQPIEYIYANKLDYCEGAVVKYITRWRKKGGKQDLEKIIHYVNLIIEMEGL